MKNMIKKISAFAMAFTLLGTGTAITNIVAPQLSCTITANAAGSKFIDVDPDDWFADAVEFVYNSGIMIGTSANTFSPYAEITREQFAMVLFNMADDPEKNKTIYQDFYTDVADGQWYTTAVMWAHCWEITKGYGDKFGVGDKITREQLVTMLYNYETKFKKRPCNAPSNALDKFSDRNKVSSWALTPMRWAVANGIVSGKGNNKLVPQDTASRAECAQIIKNYSNPYNYGDKILKDTTLGLSADKKRTLATICNTMLNEGYELSFTAGVLGNIACEGTFGKFESSNYATHPELEPDYLKYMDKHYNYRSKFSGKTIDQVNLSEVYTIICAIDKKNYYDTKEKSRCGFGIGCVQWTFGRAKGLIEKYRVICSYSDHITPEQVMLAESLYIVDELNSSYHKVYTNWSKQNSNKNTSNAAYNAGKIVCTEYERPSGYTNKQNERGEKAKKIFEVLVK